MKKVTIVLEMGFTEEDWEFAIKEFGGNIEGVLDMIKNEVSYDFPDDVKIIEVKFNE